MYVKAAHRTLQRSPFGEIDPRSNHWIFFQMCTAADTFHSKAHHEAIAAATGGDRGSQQHIQVSKVDCSKVNHRQISFYLSFVQSAR
jgi:hypothetical protein